jgi:hypothetical protein
MQDDRRRDKDTTEVTKRDSDATSKETVADVTDDEKSDNSSNQSAPDSSVPSPDGALDEKDERDDAAPV